MTTYELKEMLNNLIEAYGLDSDAVDCFVTLMSEFQSFRLSKRDLKEVYELLME